MAELLIALLPFILLFALIVLLKMPAITAMPLTYLLSAIIGVVYWKINIAIIAAASIKGLIIALDIFLIVVGAIFLLEVLRQAKFIQIIDNLLKHISHDRRIHIIIVAWSFGAFIEGAAGFGSPAALAAPLLVGLGVPALSAVIVSLIANSTPVSFGAIGTPLIIGLGTITTDIKEITIYTAVVHSIIGLFMPLLISCISTKLGKEKSFRNGLEIWPFALFAGACFVLPYLAFAIFLGPEFPSILGGLIGFILLIAGAKKGFFIQKKFRLNKVRLDKTKAMHALAPYFLVAVILVLSRIRNVNSILKRVDIGISNLFNTGISQSFYPLVSPGIIFLIVSLIALFFIKLPKESVKNAIKNTAVKSGYTFIALSFTVALVQIFISSGYNSSGLPSIPIVIAKGIVSLTGNAFVVISPLIGIFGAFIGGSNTVSNLLFGAFQQQTAFTLGLPQSIILALQNVGGAAGNMIAINNIIAASAIVGLKGEEGAIIKNNIVPALLYGLIAGIIGFVLIKAVV
ncbi:L-lactate permease [Candidatus Woesearchaeota archaeon]|nr:L-lactate permease [Candidatus Woesearchaeota archaeon]